MECTCRLSDFVPRLRYRLFFPLPPVLFDLQGKPGAFLRKVVAQRSAAVPQLCCELGIPQWLLLSVQNSFDACAAAFLINGTIRASWRRDATGCASLKDALERHKVAGQHLQRGHIADISKLKDALERRRVGSAQPDCELSAGHPREVSHP